MIAEAGFIHDAPQERAYSNLLILNKNSSAAGLSALIGLLITHCEVCRVAFTY